MKHQFLLLSLLCSTLSMSPAFAETENYNNNVNVQHNAQQNANVEKNREILGWLVVLNQNEIAAAKEVATKKVNPMVQNYAHWLYKQHTQGLHDTIKTSRQLKEQPFKSEAAVSLQQEGEKVLANLKSLDNTKQFQNSYIEDMIKGHQEALNHINNVLLKNTNNPKLERLIKVTRHHVSEHLQRGIAIQKKLNSMS
ncbi:MAG: DUF4142 domain-containing protein [Gammaproteobacteria bacterium]|nr:DUF4142 domain-containing protein [Gammaproteobacteria bacterium]